MISKDDYQIMLLERHPKSKHLKTMIWAFMVGGLICVFGEGVKQLIQMWLPSWEAVNIGHLTAIILIFFSSIATAFGLYDKLTRHAGAGAIIPITGFANAVTAPALEFRREGFVFGTMARMFSVAGPVIVAGVSSSVVVGIIYVIVYAVKGM